MTPSMPSRQQVAAQRAIADAHTQMNSVLQRLARQGRVVDTGVLVAGLEDLERAAIRMQRNARIVIELITNAR